MATKIKLLNNQGDELTLEHSDTTSAQGNSVVNIKDLAQITIKSANITNSVGGDEKAKINEILAVLRTIGVIG